jgi:trimeric autotransporter adhesin
LRSVSQASATLAVLCAGVMSAACSESDAKSPTGPTTEVQYSVSISPKASTLAVGQSQQLVAQVKQDNRVVTDQAIEWRTVDAAVATVSNNGVVTAAAAGTTKIVARTGQASDSATITVQGPDLPFTIVPGAVNAMLGDTLQLAVVNGAGANVAASGGVVTWSSSDATIASVSSDGVVNTLAEGEVTLRADMNGQTATAALKINGNPVAAITVSPSNNTIYPGEVLQLTAASYDDNRRSLPSKGLSWSTSDPSIATVTGTGRVKAIAKGLVVITAQADGKRASATVNVLGTPVATVAVSLAKSSIGVGQTTTATALLKDSQGNTLTDKIVAWQSSNPALATVNASGVVTGVAAGTVTISAISDGKVGSASLSITQSRAVTVAITPASPTAMVGRSAQLGLDVRDATGAVLTGRPVTWASATPAIATISSTGMVSALSVGSTTITATVDGVSATAQFTVTTVPVTSVAVAPTQLALNPGATAQLSVAAASSTTQSGSTRPVAWSSSNPGVATVDANGLVTAVSGGTARVSATVEGVSASADVTVAAAAPPQAATISITFNSSAITPGQSTQAVATVRDAAGNVLVGRPVVWASADPTMATVSSSGLVTALSAGTVTVIATTESVVGAATITITSAAPAPVANVALSVTPSSISAGGTAQATVTLTDATRRSPAARSPGPAPIRRLPAST